LLAQNEIIKMSGGAYTMRRMEKDGMIEKFSKLPAEHREYMLNSRVERLAWPTPILHNEEFSKPLFVRGFMLAPVWKKLRLPDIYAFHAPIHSFCDVLIECNDE
jgi:hypothetical protein